MDQSSKTLEAVRAWTQEATPQRVQEISGMHIDVLKDKMCELYGLLKTKHNTTTNSRWSTVCGSTTNHL